MLLVVALAPPAPAATTYYVRASGSESADGLTPQTARASIRQAALLLREPGDRLVVGPGTYLEGNVGTKASGTADQPIVFSADTTGAMTGDPPGPVTIRPPNTFDATSGFLIFGRHDLVIEGFTIEGARDPGIQVRPHSSTGVDATRIAVRGNTVRGCRVGIHLAAAGDLTIAGNMLENNGLGIVVEHSGSEEIRPVVTSNDIRGSTLAIDVADASVLEVTGNRVTSHRHAATFSGRHLIVRANEFDRLVNVVAEHFEFAGNVLERDLSAVIRQRGGFSGNQWKDLLRGSVAVQLWSSALLELADNVLPRTFVTGGNLVLERNSFQSVSGECLGVVVAANNHSVRRLKLHGIAAVELRNSRAASLLVVGTEVLVEDSEAVHGVGVGADSATLRRVQAGALYVVPRSPQRCEQEPVLDVGTFIVEQSRSSTVLRIGDKGRSVRDAIVRDNHAAGMLRVEAIRSAELDGNESSGLTCILGGPDTALRLTGNISRDSDGSGIVVLGGGDVTVERNTSTNNANNGFFARRVASLTISENSFGLNGGGGVAVSVPPARPGDCDGDRRVNISELIAAIRIVLGQETLHSCRAIDFNGDEEITIEEIVRAVNSALGLLPPDLTRFESRVTLRANRIEQNAEFGIDASSTGPFTATGNRVLGNGGVGILVRRDEVRDPVEIAANTVGLAALEGILVDGAAGADIHDNVVFDSGESGVLLRNAPQSTVVNNLVYANGDDGIAVGVGSPLPASDTLVMNNTVHANGGYGITVGTAGTPSNGVQVLNNILDANGGGIAAQFDSQSGLTTGFNLNNDGTSPGVVAGPTDFTAAAGFANPAGADGVLGGEGFADDDFRLLPESAAIDAGSATAAELGICGAAVAGTTADEGIVDLGFHYGAAAGCPGSADLD